MAKDHKVSVDALNQWVSVFGIVDVLIDGPKVGIYTIEEPSISAEVASDNGVVPGLIRCIIILRARLGL